MKSVATPTSLQDLIGYLSGLTSRVPIEELREQLNGLKTTRAELEPYVCFGEHCYQRNPVCSGPWFELLCICWRAGQRSLIHNHAGSTCGLRIIDGRATEVRFELDEAGRAVPAFCDTLEAGQVCCTQDQDIHQVCNNQSGDRELITLHIYSPALGDMQTWDCDFPEQVDSMLANG